MMFEKTLTPQVPSEDVINAVYLVLKAISHRGNARYLTAELEDNSQTGQVINLVRQLIDEIERRADAKFNKIPKKKLEFYANKMAKIMTQRVQNYTRIGQEAAEANLGQLRSSFEEV
jgi:hypothetical protein